MVMGDALMFMGNYRAWMKELQLKHNIKIGVLSVEYSTFTLHCQPQNLQPGDLDLVAKKRRIMVINVT
jgi:hypothetical protein